MTTLLLTITTTIVSVALIVTNLTIRRLGHRLDDIEALWQGTKLRIRNDSDHTVIVDLSIPQLLDMEQYLKGKDDGQSE
jgi:hypothetical protein